MAKKAKKRGMWIQVYQGYKAIKDTGGGCRDRFLNGIRQSRLLDSDAQLGFSRLQGYQAYWRGTQGKVSQGCKAIKATGGGHMDMSLKATWPLSLIHI